MVNSKGVLCPVCNSLLTVVVDSRPKEGGIKRRRKCHECGYRFTTTEQVNDGDMKTFAIKIEIVGGKARIVKEKKNA